MIVVDENLHSQRIMEAIAAWYVGQVVSVITLRPKSLIKDDAIPALLRRAAHPTFITINVTDFWKKVEPHRDYRIITVGLPKECAREVPELVRRLFRHPDFKTKASRMGKVVSLTPERIHYYDADRNVQSLPLSE